MQDIFVARIKNQKGFTLMELVMVFVVLGVVTSVTVPRFIELNEATLAAAERYNSGVGKSQKTVEWAETFLIPPQPSN